MMSHVTHKRSITSNPVIENFKISKEVDKGSSCASVAANYSLPKQTLSNWVLKKSYL